MVVATIIDAASGECLLIREKVVHYNSALIICPLGKVHTFPVIGYIHAVVGMDTSLDDKVS